MHSVGPSHLFISPSPRLLSQDLLVFLLASMRIQKWYQTFLVSSWRLFHKDVVRLAGSARRLRHLLQIFYFKESVSQCSMTSIG